VVARALGSRSPRRRYLVGIDAKLLARVYRWLPASVTDWMLSRALRG